MKIDIDELLVAFQWESDMLRYFLDLKSGKIILLSEDGEQDKIDQMDEDDRFLPIPEKNSDDEYLQMESFVYEIAKDNFETAKKFHRVLKEPKPFHAFKDLLSNYPKLREKWFKFEENCIRNQALDWLAQTGVEIEGIVPHIEIFELDEKVVRKLPAEIRDINPRACLDCHFEGNFQLRYFRLNILIENRLVENAVKKELGKKYGFQTFETIPNGKNEYLRAFKCSKCGSENAFWDF